MIKRAFPTHPDSMTYIINFPSFMTMLMNMVRSGSGYDFNMIIMAPGTDLRKHESTANVFDVSLLPKAFGGDAVCIDEDTGTEDEACVRGWKHPKTSEFVRALER